MRDLSAFPPFNALGEPLGGVTGLNTPWYIPKRDTRPCLGCGEPLEPLAERSVVAYGYEWRWVHKGCGTMARSTRLGRAVMPLMAVGQSAGEWRQIDDEHQAARRGTAALTSEGGSAAASPATPETAARGTVPAAGRLARGPSVNEGSEAPVSHAAPENR